MATNPGLRRAYTMWAPIYDTLTRFLRWSRRRSIALLDLRSWDSVLVVGCGTGADFEFLPPATQCVAVDLTPAMLRRAAAKARGRNIRLEEMDAMALRLPDDTFDKTILHLILAVVPDPVRTLQEAERVTKPGGHLVVLDKFWNRDRRPPLVLRLANAVLGGYVTAVDRNFRAILAHTSLEVLQEIPLGFGGLFSICSARPRFPWAEQPRRLRRDGAVRHGPRRPSFGSAPWKSATPGTTLCVYRRPPGHPLRVRRRGGPHADLRVPVPTVPERVHGHHDDSGAGGKAAGMSHVRVQGPGAADQQRLCQDIPKELAGR